MAPAVWSWLKDGGYKVAGIIQYCLQLELWTSRKHETQNQRYQNKKDGPIKRQNQEDKKQFKCMFCFVFFSWSWLKRTWTDWWSEIYCRSPMLELTCTWHSLRRQLCGNSLWWLCRTGHSAEKQAKIQQIRQTHKKKRIIQFYYREKNLSSPFTSFRLKFLRNKKTTTLCYQIVAFLHQQFRFVIVMCIRARH